MNSQHIPVKSQAGVVLIISLIMLMLLTMIGVNAMQATGLEEKMAGNMRDRNLAFQAAESALKAGENFLGSKSKAELDALVFDCVGSDGLFQEFGTGCAAGFSDWNSIDWNANSALYAGDLKKLKSNPRYIIESVPSLCVDANADGDCNDKGDARAFRVTARGTGGSDVSVVMVQSIYNMVL